MAVSPVIEFVKYISIVCIGLLPIMNPLSTIPLYIALTKRMSKERKRKQVHNTCIYAFSILTLFLILGQGIISVFNISLPGIRIAGGIIIMILALRMIFSGEDTSSEVNVEPSEIKNAQTDYSFSPLAMPSLAGPGSIAVVMSFSSQIPVEHPIIGHIIVILAILIAVVVTYMALSSACFIERILGEHGMHAVNRIMGFLLTCSAVQFLASGIHDFYIEFAKA